MTEHENPNDIFNYGDPHIASAHAPIPRWLRWNYIFWVVWGIVTWHIYWNGSTGDWLDRGYWEQLQRAANTTFPAKNVNFTLDK